MVLPGILALAMFGISRDPWHANAQPALDTVAVIGGVIAEVRADHPRLSVALDSQFVDHCTPSMCGGWTRIEQPFLPGLADTLRQRGLVEEFCRPTASATRCGRRGSLYVSVSRIYDCPHPAAPGSMEPGVWVQVTVYAPCGPGCPSDFHGTWYRLASGADGKWRIVEARPTFAV